MFTFIMISDDDLTADIERCFRQIGEIEYNTEGFMVTHLNDETNGWIGYLSSLNIVDDYDSNEMAQLKKLIPSPKFFLIEGSDRRVKFSDLFLMNFHSSSLVLIDNDHGIITGIEWYKHRALAKKNWLYTGNVNHPVIQIHAYHGLHH